MSKSFVSDAGLTFTGRAFAVVFGLVNQSLLAYTLGLDLRGSLAVCVAFSEFIVVASSFGVDTGTVYFLSSKKFSPSDALVNVGVCVLLLSAVGVAIAYSLLYLPIPLFAKATPSDFLFCLCLIPTLQFSNVLSRALTAFRDFRAYGVILSLRSAAQLLFTVIFVVVLGWGVKGGLLALLITHVTVAAGSLLAMRRRLEFRSSGFSLARIREFLHYGCRCYFAKIANHANNQIGVLALGMIGSAADVGIYAVACRIIKLIEIIPDVLNSVLLPRVSSDPEGRKLLVARVARLVAVASCGLLVVLCIVAKPFVTVLFSSAFVPAAVVIQILAIGALGRCIAKVMVPYLSGTNRPGLGSVAVVIGLVVNISLILLMADRMDSTLMAWATTLNYVISSTIIMFAFVKLSEMPFTTVFGFGYDDVSLLTNSVARFLPRSITERINGTRF